MLRGFVQDFAARGSGCRAIFAEGTVQIGQRHLNWIVDDVAEEDRGIISTFGADRDVAGSVAGRGEDGKQIMDLLLPGNELGLAGLNYREHAVFENVEEGRRLGGTILRGEACVLFA